MGRVARIVPEFCARAEPENCITPGAARKKEFFARGVFYLLNCCTNGVIPAKAGTQISLGGRPEAVGWRPEDDPGTPISRLALEERWELLFNRRGRRGTQRTEDG